ncbi:MAG TPA: hypothetical protein PKN95_09305 [Verrucomicrobiota bacterium]|nr:hypothetical protein [Verrucomicrobiota bacterium]HNT15905.1 hypothetical protein [Verrucomicrobiota bacterium]
MKPGTCTSLATQTAASCDTEFLSRHATKVILQDNATRRYLTATGLWTTQPETALTFRSGSAAVEYAAQKSLKHVNLVLIRAITVSEVIPVQNYASG